MYGKAKEASCEPHIDTFTRKGSYSGIEAVAEPDIDVADLLLGDLAQTPVGQAFK